MTVTVTGFKRFVQPRDSPLVVDPYNRSQRFGGTFNPWNYVPGQSFYAQGFDPNGNFDPRQTLVLNSHAWQDTRLPGSTASRRPTTTAA